MRKTNVQQSGYALIKNAGKTLDCGVERTFTNFSIALNFNIATNLSSDKQQGVEQEKNLTKDLSVILSIVNVSNDDRKK